VSAGIPSDAKQFQGVDRAAIFLLSLGEDAAASILRHLGPREVQKVGVAMANMRNVSKLEVAKVMREFLDEVEDRTALGVGSDEYVRKMLVEALGEGRAEGLIDRILLGRNSKGLEALKWMDARAVAETIRLEHPQIIAIVLAYLEADHAAEVLMNLPETIRSDLLMRISALDGIHPSALNELDNILEKQFSGSNSSIKSSRVGGIKMAAEILNFVETSTESEILESISKVDEALGQEIQDHMFVFDNLIEVDDRGIQSLLREVSTDVLILALKAGDQGIKDKILKNMSKRAAETLLDDLEAKGPVRLSEVEAAQKEILMTARRMAEAGDLALGGKGGDEYV
jgi:flagellar motor switch protein FliG